VVWNGDSHQLAQGQGDRGEAARERERSSGKEQGRGGWRTGKTPGASRLYVDPRAGQQQEQQSRNRCRSRPGGSRKDGSGARARTRAIAAGPADSDRELYVLGAATYVEGESGHVDR
jgi:hypothetical protein